ncbi:hypothetical protein AYO21_07754 [Fonsecaea monophora]|uniref:Uncharacterized protein n=1 Tax=Fonsecaea monophora TaxID=254056 RepID=A0A177F404_9EURO|nr:hypothetical protein AYO21_07754 [Fonsecaea monophora]OAG38032.1 hypothetical protein AYO21_07754 [Fonsecaea monophora]
MEGREPSLTKGETVSTNGNDGTTEVQQRAQRQKTGDSEAKDLTKDERIELAGHDIDDACGQFEEKMKTRDYRPFVDESGFVYRFTLVRKDILKNRLAKHRMKVRYAPHFSSQPDTNYPICHGAVEGKRGEPGKDMRFRCSEDPELRSRLPPCPVPMYIFSKQYPFSRNPVIESSLPRHLRPSNSKLRVRIPDPWALSLQLFESDSVSGGRRSARRFPSLSGLTNAGSRRATKSYACYSVHTRSDMMYVQTLAPSGSTFDFAWDMFCNFFNNRVGADWNDVQAELTDIRRERLLSENLRGKDGADDGQRLWLPISTAPQCVNEGDAAADSVEPRRRKPSVTVLMHSHKTIPDTNLEIQARTPESGW